MSATTIRQLRIIGITEGISFLILLGIAMPLKYLAGFPAAVRVVGLVHGVLFILYALAAVHAVVTSRWSFLRLVKLMCAAILPLGTFAIDPWLRREQHLATERG